MIFQFRYNMYQIGTAFEPDIRPEASEELFNQYITADLDPDPPRMSNLSITRTKLVWESNHTCTF